MNDRSRNAILKVHSFFVIIVAGLVLFSIIEVYGYFVYKKKR